MGSKSPSELLLPKGTGGSVRCAEFPGLLRFAENPENYAAVTESAAAFDPTFLSGYLFRNVFIALRFSSVFSQKADKSPVRQWQTSST
jgi:hypothetical protein